jgi:hypothetical protein
MKKRQEKIKIGENGFWQNWFSKLLFTLISVKVWGLVACTWVSTYLLIETHIDKGQWLTFNTTIWALIFGMKEIFRIAEKRDNTESENLKELGESKYKLASLISDSSSENPSATQFTPDGFEIVGEEPDSQD